VSDQSKTEKTATVVNSISGVVRLTISVSQKGSAKIIPLKAKLGKTLAKELNRRHKGEGLKAGDEVIVNLPAGIQKDSEAISGMVVRMKEGMKEG